MSDWKLHLNTLFPEVRLKNTLELRSCDSQNRELQSAIVAVLPSLVIYGVMAAFALAK